MCQIAITECRQRAQKITHVPTAEARGRCCCGLGCSQTISFGLRIHASGRDNRVMASASDDFNLTMNELRAVVRFAAESAQTVLAEFEADAPDDTRPREALTAALAFAEGTPRTDLQRTTAFAAHRAAKSAPTEIAVGGARLRRCRGRRIPSPDREGDAGRSHTPGRFLCCAGRRAESG
jgi:hypothetical protein